MRQIVFASILIVIAAVTTIAVAADAPNAPRPAWTTSRVHGSPVPPEPFRIEPAFPKLKFEKPSSLEQFPDSGRLLVTEMSGKVFSFPKDAAIEQADLVLDLRAMLPKELAGRSVSLWDAEFHPKFKENRYLLVSYVHPGEGNHTRLSRFTLDRATPPRVVPDSEHVILTWPAGGHNAGCLEFSPEGLLYIATGDGSGPNPPDGLTTGQTVDDLLGAILRIDIDHQDGDKQYTIPKDNPFVDLAGARAEIWAYGLRNPWKFGVDGATGNVFAADNGWETWEMVHKIVRGGNCGWPVMEGRAALRSEVKPGPTPILPPVQDHPHTEANSVIGGPVYRGSKLTDLAGQFVYGDYITGTIWSLRESEGRSYSRTTLVDTDLRIVAFLQAAAGELYVLDYDLTGQIYELLPSGVKDTSASFPRRLSETGLFGSLKTMEPAPGVVPYSVRASRWEDGARAQFWAAIPGTGKIQLATADAPAVYPADTVLVKHLTLPPDKGRDAIRLETQLLHFDRGVWRPYSYLWDDEGKDAALVDSIGASRPLRMASGQGKPPSLERTWQVNATNECKLCHNAGPKFVLGFTVNQLNRPDAASGTSEPNQLQRLTTQGVLAATQQIAADDPLTLVNPHDPAQGLNDRARSYLHANCGMCHHPGGNAIVSFYLRRDLPFDKLNTNKGTGIGTFGMRDAKIIVPGDPYRSVLFYRMSKLGYARMPYIGSRVVDSFGVSLVEEWIRSLPKPEGVSPSPPTIADSAESKAIDALANKKSDASNEPDKAVGELMRSTEGALALVTQIHRRRLPEPAFRAAVAVGGTAPTSDIRGLFETFIPESKRRATLGSNIDPQVILSRKGDFERGKLIFFSDGARCRNCHDVNDRDKSLGPTLTEIAKKHPRPPDLLLHVLLPSQKIDEPFAAYTVVTDDGRAISGLLVRKTQREVILKTLEKNVVKIAHENIDELRKSDKSLMPDRILSDLTAQEAADLVAYILSQN